MISKGDSNCEPLSDAFANFSQVEGLWTRSAMDPRWWAADQRNDDQNALQARVTSLAPCIELRLRENLNALPTTDD